MSKPSIPKGTRDFTPAEMVRRNFIFDTIRSVFTTFGYLPIETPAMENLSSLLGKYGDEGDKLLFRILNSGDFMDGFFIQEKALTFFKKELSRLWDLRQKTENLKEFKNILTEQIDPTISKTFTCKYYRYKSIFDKAIELKKEDFVNYAHRYHFEKINWILNIKSDAIQNYISEKGLRYDLTVPFARFVVQHQSELTFPFRRYQIQPVWRADRPQKGRYREFYQCDVDVIGSRSLLNEAELVQIIDVVFERLKINVLVKINNRKVLSGIAEVIGEADKLVDITVAIDKIDKIGLDAVKAELQAKGVSQSAIARLEPILTLKGTTVEKLNTLEAWLATSPTGMLGVEELRTLFTYLDALSIKQEVELDLSLARGLSYYTGAIFEVKAKDTEIGSITGGGRYDDLTGIFGLKDMSGVGISFGADRIYDVMTTLNLFPEHAAQTTRLLFANLGEREELYILPLAAKLRKQGVAVEIYPDKAKLKKQLEYADKRSIPFMAVAGENEMAKNTIMLKNMHTGEQVELPAFELLSAIIIHK